ncbi:GNAT superfamily N-acetyltransferase [Rhizobium skierniewicense]|uniref:GNAT superfamily N-acetyltransferase n=1 Tax=Rhizobium skierniewicense TaxID=984260 RepID=A0A7W6G1I2_9HYPH|nr:GNAT family N-acetyltransferase [Rhizobium skierniewicense]MBB3945484.1 GNAT superfamily N-acetyltransferase [Rhizobium skierniewicense]
MADEARNVSAVDHHDTLQLEAFELTLENIADANIEKLHALSVGVGWPHRPKDWQMLLENGNGVVAVDSIGRLAGSAMWFDFGSTFSTIGMVITPPRLQARGAGSWMMLHVMQQAGKRQFGLNATRAAKRLYQSMGFSIETTVFQCQGEAKPVATPQLAGGATLRPMTSGDVDTILALDEKAFGAGRNTLFNSLLPVSKGVVLVRGQRVEAFSLCRRFGRGALIGPVVAFNAGDAIAVTHPHVVEHEGQFLRLDTREESGAFAQYVASSGMSVFDTVTTMSLGGRWMRDRENEEGLKPRTWALASQAFG